MRPVVSPSRQRGSLQLGRVRLPDSGRPPHWSARSGFRRLLLVFGAPTHFSVSNPALSSLRRAHSCQPEVIQTELSRLSTLRSAGKKGRAQKAREGGGIRVAGEPRQDSLVRPPNSRTVSVASQTCPSVSPTSLGLFRRLYAPLRRPSVGPGRLTPRALPLAPPLAPPAGPRLPWQSLYWLRPHGAPSAVPPFPLALFWPRLFP